MMREVLLLVLGIVAVLAAAMGGAYLVLRSSLPPLDGDLTVAGTAAPVTIERDALGIPTITASNRADLAFATGFVHAQDRFFQMDLSRRLAAGELAELVGEAALVQDERARRFRFRHVAREVLERSSREERELLEAYARGVNAGLESLGSRPWEYWLVAAKPQQWRPEDTLLVSYAMWWDLQYTSLRRELVRRAVNARLDGPVCEFGWRCALKFLYPRGTSWDAPNTLRQAAPTPTLRVPAPEELNVRGAPGTPEGVVAHRRDKPVGSNGWVVSGALTDTGAALVANDMHLTLHVPAAWYRARFRVGGEQALDLNGLTLPGAPVLVAGSNGYIAWGFTNSYGDWADVELVPCVQVSDTSLDTGSETIPLSVVRETIRVKSGQDVAFALRSGAMGVLFEEHPEDGWCAFARWLATVPEASNLGLLQLERATSVAEAISSCSRRRMSMICCRNSVCLPLISDSCWA